MVFLHDNVKVLANQGLAQVVPVTHAHEAGHFSDTTASAAGSDDEGSTAATDGSTLRTSPAEQVHFCSGSIWPHGHWFFLLVSNRAAVPVPRAAAAASRASPASIMCPGGARLTATTCRRPLV